MQLYFPATLANPSTRRWHPALRGSIVELCLTKIAVVPPRGRVAASSLPALALSALGVVFGDIGTSPLYTLKTVLSLTGPHPDPVDVSDYFKLLRDAVVELGREVAI